MLNVILREVLKYFPDISEKDLISRSRKREIAIVRQIYFYLCRKLTSKSCEFIGKTLNRDHTTVLYSYERIEGMLEIDKKFQHEVGCVINHIEREYNKPYIPDPNKKCESKPFQIQRV